VARTQMKLTQIGDADRLARKLSGLKTNRKEWSEVDLTVSLVPQRINSEARSPHRLPGLDDDLDMHQAIVEAVIKEYDDRINSITNELVQMGVEL
jgi:hypothetical protein